MDRARFRPRSPERTSSTEDIHSDTSSETSSQPPTPDAVPTKPPSLRPTSNPMAPSSAPLGAINAARRPVAPSHASGFTSDIREKMKNFSLSRQGAPPPGIGANSPRLMPGKAPVMPGKGPMGGLAAKRGIRPGGMKLSDAQKGPDPAEQNKPKEPETQFSKYSNIVDTKKGTLNFANKAVLSSTGVEFAGGSSFSISLDEVDTIDELGKGNYGTVFKVRHARPQIRRPGLGLRGNMVRQSSISNPSDTDEQTQTVSVGGTSGLLMAMKEMRLELDDSKFATIIMELDILHRCVSPFIIDFYGAFFQEGSVYICIEYMDGGSLDKIYGGGVPENVLKKVTLSTVMGLKCLKDDHNIIHRDVKPTNILVNTRGQVKICDFGVSGNLVASIAKTNIGCQSYMAPERISGGGLSQAGANPGGGTYSVQSDIWSLGLTIIECALGRYPYPPDTYDNIFSQLSAIVDGDPPDLPADSYSEAAQDFVRGCLNKVAKMRPTYAMLIRHAWLAPLMKPPTIAEDEEAEAAAEAGLNGSIQPNANGALDTADKEVSEWVKSALERKRSGKMPEVKKPALHEAPLDTVPGSPLSNQNQAAVAAANANGDRPMSPPNPGVAVETPALISAKIHDMDFAG